MALTLEKLQDLKDAGLVTLFNKHKKLWREHAEQAFDYIERVIKPTGNQVRQDDVVPILEPVLDLSDVLRSYLGAKKLRQKYWHRHFAELIVDQLWTDLTKKEGNK